MEVDRPLIRISVADGKGYVWNAQEFKNQNSVNGLPLELHADEVTLAVQKGWAVVYCNSSISSSVQPPAASTSGPAEPPSKKRKQQQHDDYDDYYNDYYAQGEGEGTGSAAAVAVGSAHIQQPAAPPAAAPAVILSPDEAAAAAAEESEWRAALADGSFFTIPIVHERLGGAAQAGADEASASASWTYPTTPYERLRFAVFSDLHSMGFMMTGGAKFGCDMLAYPGDPTLYHAQFTVRIVLPGVPINPMLLKSAGRGSHAARKHLLLATFPQGLAAGGDLAALKPAYVSIAPESGFGSKA